MIKEYQSKSNLGIFAGIILTVVGSYLVHGTLSLVILALSLVAWIYGCAMYAQAKGYSGAVGLLGLLSVLGLLILILMPDKTKNSQTSPTPPAS